jgi:hypothetical protein
VRFVLPRGWIIASLLFGLGACKSTSTELRARFAKERSCSADRVRVVEEGGHVYRATGCEKRAEYVCGTFAGTNDVARACQERELPRQAPLSEPRPFPEPVDRPPVPGPTR